MDTSDRPVGPLSLPPLPSPPQADRIESRGIWSGRGNGIPEYLRMLHSVMSTHH